MREADDNRPMRSIKWSFALYIPVSFVIAYAGAYAIGMWGNEFWLMGYGQIILIPLWVLLTFFMAGVVFYKRELEKPIKLLMEASDKIADNRLDFSLVYPTGNCDSENHSRKLRRRAKVFYPKKNELGMLCDSFEKMRAALYRNHQEMWRMLEARKSLNAAFSHDMRTPITVLKGYRDLLLKYIPGGEVPEEKVMEILKRMSGQIDRLENYTQKMNVMQKLEDIVPVWKEKNGGEFVETCMEIGGMMAKNLQTVYMIEPDFKKQTIRMDEELVLEVYENLLSNAVRYAKTKLEISISTDGGALALSVEDDGDGFTDEALRQAAKPFYRGGKKDDGEEEEAQNHFGVGLYLCKMICEKCGGELQIENGRYGGKVTAVFCDEEKNKSR